MTDIRDEVDDKRSYFPPSRDFLPPWEPPPPPPPLRVTARPHLTTFGVTTAVLVLLGAPLALLWRAVTPRVAIRETPGGPQPVAPESDQVFAVDGWFVLVCLVVGVVLGAAAWFLLRERGPAAPLGLAVGGVLAASVAAAVGKRLVVDRYLYDFCNLPDIDCGVYGGTLHLHSPPAVIALPVGLLVAFLAMHFFLADDDEEPAPPPVF